MWNIYMVWVVWNKNTILVPSKPNWIIPYLVSCSVFFLDMTASTTSAKCPGVSLWGWPAAATCLAISSLSAWSLCMVSCCWLVTKQGWLLCLDFLLWLWPVSWKLFLNCPSSVPKFNAPLKTWATFQPSSKFLSALKHLLSRAHNIKVHYLLCLGNIRHHTGPASSPNPPPDHWSQHQVVSHVTKPPLSYQIWHGKEWIWRYHQVTQLIWHPQLQSEWQCWYPLNRSKSQFGHKNDFWQQTNQFMGQT